MLGLADDETVDCPAAEMPPVGWRTLSTFRLATNSKMKQAARDAHQGPRIRGLQPRMDFQGAMQHSLASQTALRIALRPNLQRR